MNLANAAAQAAIQGVTFRSTITPDFAYDPWAPSQPSPPGSFNVMGFVRPAIDIMTPAGPITIAPYGDPADAPNYGMVALLGTAAMVVGFFTLAGWLAKKLG